MKNAPKLLNSIYGSIFNFATLILFQTAQVFCLMDIKLTTELIKRRKGGKIESCYSIMQSSFHYFLLVNCTLEATALSLFSGVKGIKVEKFSLD